MKVLFKLVAVFCLTVSFASFARPMCDYAGGQTIQVGENLGAYPTNCTASGLDICNCTQFKEVSRYKCLDSSGKVVFSGIMTVTRYGNFEGEMFYHCMPSVRPNRVDEHGNPISTYFDGLLGEPEEITVESTPTVE